MVSKSKHVTEARWVKHKSDVDYVRRNHPELADWLTTYAALFGRSEVDYRVVLRKRTEVNTWAEK